MYKPVASAEEEKSERGVECVCVCVCTVLDRVTRDGLTENRACETLEEDAGEVLRISGERAKSSCEN